MMIMQTCQHYAEKMCNHQLTEYEVLMYEALSRAVKVYAECQRLGLESVQRRMEIEEIQEKIAHNEKLKELGKEPPQE